MGEGDGVRRAHVVEVRRRGLGAIAFTGRAAGLTIPADVHVAVPADRTPRVQEVQGTPLHVLCELVEEGI